MQSQPYGVKLKVRGRKLRSGVNWLGTSKQKRCKTRVMCTFFLIVQIVTVTIHNVSKSTSDKEYKSRSSG